MIPRKRTWKRHIVRVEGVKTCDQCGVRLTSREAEKMELNKSLRRMTRAEDATRRGIEDLFWFSYAEIGFLFRRSPRHIKNLVSKYRIPHVRSKGVWSQQRIALVPVEGVRLLRKLTLGI